MAETAINKLNLRTSPAGRAIAEPMDSSIVQMLYEHLTLERNSSAQYFAISIWFAERDLTGFSNFFKNESLDEQTHAHKFANYLIARGQTIVLHDLPAPKQQWDSIEDVIADSFQMEADVTTSIHQIYTAAERSNDTRTNVFLDPIVESQINSEDTFANLLSRVKFSDNQPSALLIIDGELKVK